MRYYTKELYLMPDGEERRAAFESAHDKSMKSDEQLRHSFPPGFPFMDVSVHDLTLIDMNRHDDNCILSFDTKCACSNISEIRFIHAKAEDPDGILDDRKRGCDCLYHEYSLSELNEYKYRMDILCRTFGEGINSEILSFWIYFDDLQIRREPVEHRYSVLQHGSSPCSRKENVQPPLHAGHIYGLRTKKGIALLQIAEEPIQYWFVLTRICDGFLGEHYTDDEILNIINRKELFYMNTPLHSVVPQSRAYESFFAFDKPFQLPGNLELPQYLRGHTVLDDGTVKWYKKRRGSAHKSFITNPTPEYLQLPPDELWSLPAICMFLESGKTFIDYI